MNYKTLTPEEACCALRNLMRARRLRVTPAGERHSMGGQSFSRGGLVLDMRGFDDVVVDREAMTMTVGSGASWKEIQAILDPMGLAPYRQQLCVADRVRRLFANCRPLSGFAREWRNAAAGDDSHAGDFDVEVLDIAGLEQFQDP